VTTSWSFILQASTCNTDTTPTQPYRNSNTHRTKNNTTNVAIQQNSRKLLMMDVLMSETCWAHKKWNKITSDNKLVFYSSRNFNPLTPNNRYRGRTTLLTSKRCILYIYLTNIGTEYFKHGIYSPYFPLQNAVCFIILTYLVPVLSTFCIQGVLKFKKIIPAPKG